MIYVDHPSPSHTCWAKIDIAEVPLVGVARDESYARMLEAARALRIPLAAFA